MTTSLQTFNHSALPIGSIEAYIARANQIPILTLEQERELISRFYDKGDVKAARELLLAHLRFVIRIARGYKGYGLALGDLIQEGNIGLMKAIQRFDPKVGVRFVSFAIHWVKAEIHEFILRNWRIVKIATSKAQRKLFFNLRKSTQHLGVVNEDAVRQIATDLNVSTKDVRQMHERLNSYDEAFESSDLETNDSTGYWGAENYLEDPSDPALLLESKDWSENRENTLNQALASLDERSQEIVKRRWLLPEKATLHELADLYQVSAERIRQIEKIAMNKMKVMLLEQGT